MAGTLFYVIGPSGSGKDSLINYARRKNVDGRILFAHRYITRPTGGHENHVVLSDAEFARRSALGFFALEWASHSLHYGIGVEIDLWLATGSSVVVNGSRSYLATALKRYPELRIIVIDTEPAILKARLTARGREGSSEIEKRITINRSWRPPAGAHFVTIDNSGDLPAAGERILRAFQ